MPKKTPKTIAPFTVHLTPAHRSKLNKLIAYAMLHDVCPNPGRVVRTLIDMAEPGPEFLKAVSQVDETEREAYREKRRKL